MSTPLVEQKPFNGHTQGRLVFERHDHHASKYVGNLTVHMGSGSIRTVTCQLDYGSAEENEANAVFLAHCWNTYYQREAELQSMRDRLSRMEEAGNAMSAHPPASTEPRLTVDGLANEIRTVDGSNSLGAGALAEALMPYLTKAAKP